MRNLQCIVEKVCIAAKRCIYVSNGSEKNTSGNGLLFVKFQIRTLQETAFNVFMCVAPQSVYVFANYINSPIYNSDGYDMFIRFPVQRVICGVICVTD